MEVPRAAADIRDPVREPERLAAARVLDLQVMRDDRDEVRLQAPGARVGRRLGAASDGWTTASASTASTARTTTRRRRMGIEHLLQSSSARASCADEVARGRRSAC